VLLSTNEDLENKILKREGEEEEKKWRIAIFDQPVSHDTPSARYSSKATGYKPSI